MCIGVGSIEGDGCNVAAIGGLAQAVVEQASRNVSGGGFESERFGVLCQLAQLLDIGLVRLDAQAVFAQGILQRAGRSLEVDGS
jgi:hypothetical protein